jgi:hypothetical protein
MKNIRSKEVENKKSFNILDDKKSLNGSFFMQFLANNSILYTSIIKYIENVIAAYGMI